MKLLGTYLEELKGKITATSNMESANVEIITSAVEDKKGIITITVKDTEKEYAKYIINVVQEEKKEEKEENKVAVGAISDNSSKNNGNFISKVRNMPAKYRMFAILGAYLITFLIAMAFAFIAYWKSKELAEYEHGYEDESEETGEIETLRQVELKKLNEGNIREETEMAGEKLTQVGGYRNLRGSGKSTGGRHF